jgi:hypothetical protein
VGLYRGGPASDCIPVHRKSQIYTDPSRDEVVRISSVNTQLRWGGDTFVVGLKHHFLERCFVIIGEHGNTFPTHNIEDLPRLITRRSSLPLVSRSPESGYKFQVICTPIDIENRVIMTLETNMLCRKRCF